MNNKKTNLKCLKAGVLTSMLVLLMFFPVTVVHSQENTALYESLGYEPGAIIVKLKQTGIHSTDVLNKKYEVTQMKKVFSASKDSSNTLLANVYKLSFQKQVDILNALKDYQNDPNVEYAELNKIFRAVFIPNDLYFGSQWSLYQANDCDIDATEAWNIETGSADVIIAVTDTGVNYNHPDLTAKLWINPGEDLNHNGVVDGSDFNGVDNDGNGFIDDIRGWDFIGSYSGDPTEDNNPIDSVHGHGTHCSGIASAATNNGVGIAGVCWHSKIMAVKCLDDGGYGTGETVASAIVYAAENGADVISMSLGGPSLQIEKDAIDYAYAMNVVLVAAAGNDNTNQKSYPAGYSNVIAVAATDQNDHKASFSNYGDWVDISAPGVDILSTFLGSSYDEKSGTSMACPHVAGLAALILSKNPSLSNEEVKTAIQAGADNIDDVNPGYEGLLGTGRINAFTSLQGTSINHPPLVPEIQNIPWGTGIERTINMPVGFQIRSTDLEGDHVRFEVQFDAYWQNDELETTGFVDSSEYTRVRHDYRAAGNTPFHSKWVKARAIDEYGLASPWSNEYYPGMEGYIFVYLTNYFVIKK